MTTHTKSQHEQTIALHKTRLAQFFGIAAMSALMAVGIAGCKSSSDTAAPITSASDANSPDPAAANSADTTSQPTQVLGSSSSYTPTQSSQSYRQQPAPVEQSYNDNQGYSNNSDQYNDPSYDQTESDGEQAIYAPQPPPPLPEYDQPPAPEPNYLWTPGYWAYGNGGYYWTPGVWCPPPYYGALWTPPYWGFYGGRYGFHRGYWGVHIGYYGGVDYGHGYIGTGYYGGYWQGDRFNYNRAVTNVNTTNITNVYNRTVIVNNVTYNGNIRNRVSYNGGNGGLNVRPRPAEIAAMREYRTPPVAAQVQINRAAATNKAQFFAENHGRPAQVALARPTVAVQPIAQPPARVAPLIQQRNAVVQRDTTPQRGPATQPGRPGTPNEQRPQPAAVNQQRPTDVRPVGPQQRPEQMQPNRPGTVQQQQRPGQPTPVTRPQPTQPQRTEPTPTNRPQPTQSRPQPVQQSRPEPVQQSRPQPVQQARPQPAARPEPAARPQPAARPEPAARPQPAARPEPAARPQPAARPAPAARPEPHEEKKPQ
jgi:hypothetical protein